MKTAGEPDPAPWKPLGERVQRSKPKLPEWKPLPHAPCIEASTRRTASCTARSRSRPAYGGGDRRGAGPTGGLPRGTSARPRRSSS